MISSKTTSIGYWKNLLVKCKFDCKLINYPAPMCNCHVWLLVSQNFQYSKLCKFPFQVRNSWPPKSLPPSHPGPYRLESLFFRKKERKKKNSDVISHFLKETSLKYFLPLKRESILSIFREIRHFHSVRFTILSLPNWRQK